MKPPTRRRSKYTDAVKYALEYFGHATNAQITDDLRRSYPHVSDTTIHRVTQRLFEDGKIALGPCTWDGSMVYDINTDPHDHFRCESCDALSDLILPRASRRVLDSAVAPGHADGPLLIVGTCQKCLN